MSLSYRSLLQYIAFRYRTSRVYNVRVPGYMHAFVWLDS